MEPGRADLHVLAIHFMLPCRPSCPEVVFAVAASLAQLYQIIS